MNSIFKFLTLVLLVASVNAQAQIGINNPTPDPSAALDVSSTTQGMLVPRMTQAQRTAITSPATGLLVYQTDATTGFYFYNGTAWTSLNGTNGQGVPTGGTTGQVLAKVDATNYNTQWVTPGAGAKLDLVATKLAATQAPAVANGTNTGDVIIFENVDVSPTLGTYNASTNTYTVGVGQSGLYYIQVQALSVDATPVTNTVGHWFKIEIDPNGATTSSFINNRDIYGLYPVVSNANFPSGLKARSEIKAVVQLNAGDSFVIKGLSGNSSTTGTIKNDGSCKLTVIKL